MCESRYCTIYSCQCENIRYVCAVYEENKLVADKYLRWILQNIKLERRSQLENVLIRYNFTDQLSLQLGRIIVTY